MDRWSSGRAALAGDAASSVSLFGDGSTLAVAGAHTLADELAAAPADPPPSRPPDHDRGQPRDGMTSTLTKPPPRPIAANQPSLAAPGPGRGAMVIGAAREGCPGHADPKRVANAWLAHRRLTERGSPFPGHPATPLPKGRFRAARLSRVTGCCQ